MKKPTVEDLSKPLHEDICQEHVFAGIYNRYAKDLHDYLYYKFGERLNPKDKAQEAFIKLWENCSRVTLDTAKAFLFKIANNLTLNEAKHQKVVLRHFRDKPKDYTEETPEFLMEEDEYAKKFKDALASIPEKHRIAFMLNRVEGKKHQEIAEMLGVSRKVVEYRIYSAFGQLKKVLEGFS